LTHRSPARRILRDKLRVKRQIEAPDFGAPVKCRQRIPMEVLQGRGHIHFYDQVDLIADSLGGRGSCEVTTVLAKATLRAPIRATLRVPIN
jgi:hypothetical protein